MRKCKFRRVISHYNLSHGPWVEGLFHSFTKECEAIVELKNKTVQIIPLNYQTASFELVFLDEVLK